MPNIPLSARSVRLAVLACAVAMLLAGCHRLQTVSPNTSIMDPPVPPAQEPPRELNKVSLPAYRIEPPDILQIEMLKLVPLPPYRAEVFDVLQVRVANTLVDQPIDGYFMVEAEGVINLGPAYGNVRVAGMTIDQITDAVSRHLQRVLVNPVVSVQLARVAGAQPVTGQYLVGPDGTINLRQYGVVHVSGRTVTEARVAIQKHLRQFLDSPELSVDVLAYNSKTYYVITQGAGLGDKVMRFPITGNETVLDALAQQTVGGTSPVSSKKIWIARPAPNQFGCEQILPVDWYAITQGAQTSTNYQILPGDRVYIAEDQMTALTNTIARITGPFERVLGIAGLGFSTTRAGQTMGRNYNKQRNG
jgi:polysaccharide biosynthesis/export protein